ncbi:3-oxoacyl-[acyl-carrier protein] reductase [Sphingomonas zeicaulis]|uniref:SDR family NAD(P)-dependent oxidoreductase n=1 Tax=Sphingomonas zeicaulis TaxID=1632740 RepID=UPI003D24336C
MDGNGKIVLVTGGTKGIGRAVAEHLAGLGYRLALSYSGDEDAAEATRGRLTRLGADAVVIKANSRTRADVERLFTDVRSQLGELHAVIANAGIENVEAPFAEMSEEDLDRVVDINVKGTFFTLQQAARHVVDGGRVIATGSTIARYPPPNSGAYAATKAAVRTMIEVLALELGPRGVTANSLSPGAVEGSGIFTRMDDEARQTFFAASPMGRLPRAEDLVGSVAFLLSDAARLVTGHHLEVTAGFRV